MCREPRSLSYPFRVCETVRGTFDLRVMRGLTLIVPTGPSRRARVPSCSALPRVSCCPIEGVPRAPQPESRAAMSIEASCGWSLAMDCAAHSDEHSRSPAAGADDEPGLGGHSIT